MLEDRRCMTGSASRMLLDTPFTVRIMSRRRKQANPRPLKVFEGQVGPDDGCTDITSHFEDDLEDEAVDDLDALAPLVIDTSISTKDPFEEISSQLFREQNQPTESGATSPSSESSSLSPRQSGFIWQNVSSRHHKKDEKIHPLSGINGENRYMCPVCQQVLGSSHDLTVHIRSHNSSSATQMNTCMICSKTLSSQSSLDRHMLVHSGERPFKCKICKMAFTTNGNMHRHTRIHTKEETESFTGCRGMGRRGGRGNWRSRAPSISSKACKAEAIVSNEACSNKSLPPLSTGHQQAVDSSKDALQEIPSNEHIFSLKAEEHVSPLQCQLESSSSFQREETQDVTDQEVEETLKEKEGLTLYCSVCGKGFLSKVGLERHLLTHPKFAVNRQPCDLSFRMPRSLHMHKLMAHDKLKNYDDDMTEKSLEKQPPVTLGFHDISFIDFSVEKFSLIAKARCEKISRKSSSQYHNFSCNICSKAFPCKSSLILHEYCHIPEKRTHCLVCGCEFLNNTALCIHNVKHASDDAAELFFSNFIENPNVQENMSQQNFLAHFDLISKEDSCDVKNVQDKLRCNELAENKEYFNKLAKFYPISMSTQNDTKAGSYNESTANCDIQENKSATEESVPHHISLTPPSQLDADKHTAAELLVSSQCSPLSSLSPSVSTVSPAPAGAPLNVHVSSLSVSSSSTPSTSDSGSVDLHGKKLKGMFHCKYCDLVFSNCRALKGHTRTHLGLSPYRCNLCSYSSADKSTLIRHLRTHNGERPFQCLICDFAFTTKANCERHVRKKHNKTRKEDIEKSIGYNKYVSDTHSNIDSFHSPDTICKYCGIDFKFFRALKHHLRSHSSCRQKPFMCQLCHVGFSTKANSVRHIQKQHTNISHYQIEKYIHLNEPMDNGLRLSPNASQHGDDINDISDILSNGHVRTMSAPPAHSSAVTESSVVSASLYIKAEPLSNIDQPLDFSLKKSGNNRKNYRSFGILPDNNDQPIDLSLRREDNSDIIKESVQRSSVSEQKFPLSCQYCSLHFATLTSLNDHIAGHHQLLEQAVPSCHREDIKPQNFGRSSLPSVYHYLKPGKVFAKHKKRQKLSYAFQSDSDILERESPYSIGSDSGSDLASVNKILDATGANKLQAIFNNSDHMEDSDFMPGQCRFLNDRNWPYLKEPYNAHLFKESAGELNEQTVDADALDNKALAELFHQSLNGDSLDNMLMENTADLKYDQNENKSELVVKKKRNSYADSPNKLPCPHCPRTFPWTSSLNRHLLTHTGQKPYKCPRCPVTFSTKSNRERHLIRKHGVNMLDPASRQTMDRPFKCHLCVFSSFATKDNLAKHYKERHPDTAMPDNLSDVDLSLITDKAADCEKDNEETFFMDEISDILSDDCEDEKFFELNGAKSDLSDNQGQVVDCTPLLNCGSAERQINPERDNYNVDKITKCWKCGESFSSRKLLVRHLKEHSIDLPFKCYLCDASFSCRLECLQHKEKQHVTDWQILKEKNKVKSVVQFAERMDVIVDYKCHADQSKSGQLEHVDSATEDIKHDVTVNDYLQRKVYCSLCPKRFWSLQDLRRHMRSHTGERPFECSVCQKRFTLKHSMMRHRKKHQEFGSFSDDDDDDSLPADDIAAVNALVVQREYPAECSSQSSSPSIAKKTFFISSKENSRYHESLFADASFESPGQDMLHNLLGVDASSVDKLLDSADSAARLLGVKVQEQK